jgi:GWxTD domain-containing protein
MSSEDQEPTPKPVPLSVILSARWLRLKPPHGPRPAGQRVRDPLDVPRWALSLGIILFILLFLVILAFFLLATPAAAGEGINFDRPSKDWYQGPVRYIITHQEVKAYKALETEAERATFIDWFWQRRDIVPSTPANEFRDRFEQRVFEATRKFGATSTPGWKTDMGKIYILIGPPDDVINDLVAKTHRGTVTWSYRTSPMAGLNPNTVIGFARDTSGEFRLSVQPTMDADVARGLKWQKTPMTADGRTLLPGWTDPVLLDAGAPLTQSDIETRMIYARMQTLPPKEEQMFQAMVTSKETYGAAIPMETRFDFYRAPSATYTTITVGIRSSSVQFKTVGDKEIPDIGVFGKMVSRSNPDDTYALSGDSSFAESPENRGVGAEDMLLFQAVGDFKPGLYRVILGVEDRVSRKVSSTSREVEVPDLSGTGLMLSSVTLAGAMEPGDYATSTSKPFQIGKFKLVPRPDGLFTKEDELNVYVQVYNPATAEDGGKAKMDVFYTFKGKTADGTMKEIGTYRVQDTAAQVQGYAVPLAKWPEGEYGITVTVVDKVAQAKVTADTTFVIRP